MVFTLVSWFLILLAFVGATGWWTHHCGAHWVQLFSYSVLHPSLRSFIHLEWYHASCRPTRLDLIDLRRARWQFTSSSYQLREAERMLVCVCLGVCICICVRLCLCRSHLPWWLRCVVSVGVGLVSEWRLFFYFYIILRSFEFLFFLCSYV